MAENKTVSSVYLGVYKGSSFLGVYYGPSPNPFEPSSLSVFILQASRASQK